MYHWLAFRSLIAAFQPSSICVLGVYHGRDIAFLKALKPHLRVVGVDRFTDTPGEDWPGESQGLGWREAGFGSPPDQVQAQANLDALGLSDGVTLRQGEAGAFLAETDELFDLIYIDISHDYETTRDTIAAAIPRLTSSGVLAGDDFSDGGTWGVKSAVSDAFGDRYRLLNEWIWVAQPGSSVLPAFSRLLS